jgi:hypothetical protein
LIDELRRPVEVALARRPAADERANRARARLDRDERALEAVGIAVGIAARIEAVETLGDRLLGLGLPHEVGGREDRQPPAPRRLPGDVRLEVGARVVDERREAVGARRALLR